MSETPKTLELSKWSTSMHKWVVSADEFAKLETQLAAKERELAEARAENMSTSASLGKMAAQLNAAREAIMELCEVLVAHDVDTLDCDRSGNVHCDCLGRVLNKLRACLPDGVPCLPSKAASLIDAVCGPTDTARLDWLQDNQCSLDYQSIYRDWVVQKSGQVVGNIGKGSTARGAIDMAMAHVRAANTSSGVDPTREAHKPDPVPSCGTCARVRGNCFPPADRECPDWTEKHPIPGVPFDGPVDKEAGAAPASYWGPDGRCIHCGAGNDAHHSYACPTDMHSDKREPNAERHAPSGAR